MERTGTLIVLADTDEDLLNFNKITSTLGYRQISLQYTENTRLKLDGEHHVKLIVVIAPDARKGEHILLLLYRQHLKLLQGKTSTLLLCNADHSTEAYQSCLDGVFDDYLAFHPLQDADRLRLAIHVGMQRVVPASARVLEAVGISQPEAGQSESSRLSETAELLCSRTFDKLDHHVCALPEKLSKEQLLAGGSDTYAQAVEFFQRYSRKHLRPVLEEAGTELKAELSHLEKSVSNAILQLKQRHHGIPALQQGQPRVLVINGDKGFRRSLCQQLMFEGYEALFAETATEGIALMSTKQPQLVLMDLTLPDYRGTDAIRLAKKIPATAGIPIIMMSDRIDDDTAAEVKQAGAQEFLMKPLRYGLLKEQLQRFAPVSA